MADFAKLLAESRARRAKELQEDEPFPKPISGVEGSGNDSLAAKSSDAAVDDDSGSSECVAPTPQESAPPAAKVVSGPKFGFGIGKPAAPKAADQGSTPSPVPPSTGVAAKFARFGTGSVPVHPAGEEHRSQPDGQRNDGLSGDLAALADSEEGQPLERKRSNFADEIPADAPIRELAEDVEPTMRKFCESLDSVYQVLHEPELLGKMIRTIMMELQQHPEYRKLIQPIDVRTMIKGMRDSMGMARVKKQERKRGSGGSAKPSKAIDADMLADLDALGIVED